MRKDGRMPHISVFLVDDHEAVRQGVHGLLSGEPDIEIVGACGTAAEALARIPAAHPDVAVLDVRPAGGGSVEVCREIRALDEEVGCLMLTSFAPEEALSDALLAGAAGCVRKAVHSRELVEAVRDVAAGRTLLDPEAAGRALERLRNGGPTRTARLTGRERTVLELIGEGLSNRAIADRTGLGEDVVHEVVSGLLAKLSAERRVRSPA
ncbi:response regulator transcription factor [Streptomyces lycii]|uniref:Response regulator transcription factor n=1 Tax=Streptomyces lycii TaxID=2654337 RepID=A0ABQ7FI18_9ACTN|nr:response regulator transcription factor [Streptomyces lycii]KAF4408257.1 response regulator transcription factor [Streptomyces lycii]